MKSPGRKRCKSPPSFFSGPSETSLALKVGQLSPVFRTPLGWHLILLTEKNDAKFESYRLQIAQALMAEKSAKAGKGLKKYLQTLADRYKVSYLEGGYRDTTLAGVYEP